MSGLNIQPHEKFYKVRRVHIMQRKQSMVIHNGSYTSSIYLIDVIGGLKSFNPLNATVTYLCVKRKEGNRNIII